MKAAELIAVLATLTRQERTEGLGKELHTYHLLGGKAVLVMTSALDLDTDGFTAPGAVMDRTHQSDTSLHWPHGSAVDSNLTRFVVIPGHGWAERHGLRLGDVGLALIEGCDEVVGIIIADIGPPGEIGEGSLELHRSLGHEALVDGRVHDMGMDGLFRMLLFPGSGTGVCRDNATNQALAFQLLSQLTA